MNKNRLTVLKAILPLVILTLSMYCVYFGSRHIGEETTRVITATVSGAIYFC